MNQLIVWVVFAFYSIRIVRDFIPTLRIEEKLSKENLFSSIFILLLALLFSWLGARTSGTGISLLSSTTSLSAPLILLLNGVLPPIGYWLARRLFRFLYQDAPRHITSWHMTGPGKPYMLYISYPSFAIFFHYSIVVGLAVLFRS